MPRWDIQCRRCGKTWPDMTFNTVDERDAVLAFVRCPFCEGDLVAAPSAPNFKLVGKGFHCVDYKEKK